MEITINENSLAVPPEIFLKKAGYNILFDRTGGEDSFVRLLGRNFYPRFHVYIKRQGGNIIFNLHLDQKRPMYPGAHAHNAEYEGEVVEAEIERLKSLQIHETNNFKS